jgi:hypothetical protein
MSKYAPLATFLDQRRTSETCCSFSDIERALGFRLPPAARAHRAWWSNNHSNNVMTKVWMDAGFRAEQVDMARETVVFRRVDPEATARPATGPVRRIDDTELIARILDGLRGDPGEAQRLRERLHAALDETGRATAIDLFGSDLPDDAFDGVFDQPRQKGWREVEL